MSFARLKLLFIAKRYPQGKDLFTRPYGRFFHIPRLLAKRGHDVHFLLLSYCNKPSFAAKRDGINWISESALPYGPRRYLLRARETVKSLRPDWVVGFSDTYFGIIAEHLARRYDCRSAIDAYDNYESYIPWLKPLHRLWRNALSGADVVTAAGPQLATLLQRSRPCLPVHVVPMAADSGFKLMNRGECRRRLKLPLDVRLIGYCGSIDPSRGINTLFDAFDELCQKRSDVRLILAGRCNRFIRLPHRAQWLGYLPDENMPALLNCMDVLTVTGSLSAFGRYSYPVKLYEAMSCHVPVVATATEPAAWILNDQKEHLSEPKDASDLSRKIEHLLDLGRNDYANNNSWEKSTDKFETALMTDQTKALT